MATATPISAPAAPASGGQPAAAALLDQLVGRLGALPELADPADLRDPSCALSDQLHAALTAVGVPERSGSPVWADRHVDLGRRLYQAGRLDLSVLVLRRAARVQPENRRILAEILRILRTHDDLPLYRRWLRRALVLDPHLGVLYGRAQGAADSARDSIDAVRQACRKIASSGSGAALTSDGLQFPLVALYHDVRDRGADPERLKPMRRACGALSMRSSSRRFLEEAVPAMERDSGSWEQMRRIADLGFLIGRPEISQRALQLHRRAVGDPDAAFWPMVKRLQQHGLALEEGFYPFSVILETVNACNARCVMCPVSSTWRVRKRMSDVLFDRLVAELAAWPHRPMVQLHGVGEPLLFKPLPDRIRALRAAGLPVSFTSNGGLMSEDRAEAILDADPNLVQFSLESTRAEPFEQIRLGLRFETVVANIERFIAIRDRRRSPTRVSLMMVRAPETWNEVGRFIEQWQQRLQRREIIHLAPRHNFTHDYSDRDASDAACTSPFQQINVTSDGLVTACCLDSEQKTVFGDLAEQSMHAIYNGEGFTRMRQLHRSGRRAEVAACAGCNAPEAWAAELPVFRP